MTAVTTVFDPLKPVQTRDGRKVRILTTDRRNLDYPIVALLGDGDSIAMFTREGCVFRSGNHTGSDLINVPEPVVTYVNIYPQGIGGASPNAIGVLKVTITGNAVTSEFIPS